MWITTAEGFYSAVAHDTDDNLLVVRSRVKSDALNLARYVCAVDDPHEKGRDLQPEDLLVTYANSDYPWRVMVFRDTFKSFLADTITSLDYGNFKDRVRAVQGPKRAATYGRVWHDLLSLEADDPDAQPNRTLPWIEDEPPTADMDNHALYPYPF